MYNVKIKIFKKQVEMHLTEKNGAPWSETLHRVGLLLILIVSVYAVAIAEYHKAAAGAEIIVERDWSVCAEAETRDEAPHIVEAEHGALVNTWKQGEDIESLIRAAFPEHPDIMIAIAKAESGLNHKAVNMNRNGSTDTGLFQINSIHGYDELSLFSPEKNIKAAREIYDKQGLGAWVAFKSGSYKKFLTD